MGEALLQLHTLLLQYRFFPTEQLPNLDNDLNRVLSFHAQNRHAHGVASRSI